MTEAELKKVLPGIPAQPGIYKYFDAEKKLLYVGKAKHLRKRVSSYFTKTLQSYKTQELVRRIHTIEFTVVNSEQDAFFLENSLIKQYQPVFNIDLKDDKSYPFIKPGGNIPNGLADFWQGTQIMVFLHQTLVAFFFGLANGSNKNLL